MLEDRERARRISNALKWAGRGVQAKIAKECEISDQAIYGWKTTGKIDIAYIPSLARNTQTRIDYFIDETVPDSKAQLTGPVGHSAAESDAERHAPVEMSQQVVDSINKNSSPGSRLERLDHVKLGQGYEALNAFFTAASKKTASFQVDEDLDLLADMYEALMTSDRALLRRIEAEVVARVEKRKGVVGNGEETVVKRRRRTGRDAGRLRDL